MLIFRRLLFIICWLPGLSWSQESLDDSLPLWDYGIALAYLRFAYYPASDQTKTWYLPVPTFAYRGEILRSTRRDGTRAYFIRSNHWSLELGGEGVPEVKSNETFARQGMQNIPWSLQLGPKIIYRSNHGWQLGLGLYKSIVTDFIRLSTNGFIYVGQASQVWHYVDHKFSLSFGTKGASQEYLRTYFDVGAENATPTRPTYESTPGFLSYELGIGHTYKFHKYSFFTYLTSERFELSANRKSPLHRSNENLSVAFGLNYTLGESQKISVPEREAEGLLQKIKFPSLKTQEE